MQQLNLSCIAPLLRDWAGNGVRFTNDQALSDTEKLDCTREVINLSSILAA